MHLNRLYKEFNDIINELNSERMFGQNQQLDFLNFKLSTLKEEIVKHENLSEEDYHHKCNLKFLISETIKDLNTGRNLNNIEEYIKEKMSLLQQLRNNQN